MSNVNRVVHEYFFDVSSRLSCTSSTGEFIRLQTEFSICYEKSFAIANVYCQNGVLLRTVLDSVTGELKDTRTRFLGSRAVKLFKMKLQDKIAMLAISSRSWLLYHYQNRYHLTPIRYMSLDSASGFSSEQCPEGLVVIGGNSLRILMIDKFGDTFNCTTFPLGRTPRQFVVHPESFNLMIIETDHNSFSDETLALRKKELEDEMLALSQEQGKTIDIELFQKLCGKELPPEQFGLPRAGNGMWSSAIRVMTPLDGRTLQLIPLEQNEAAQCMAIVQFNSQPGVQFLLVGVALNPILRPRKCHGGLVYTFSISSAGDRLDFIHKTVVEGSVTAITTFRGRALMSVGRTLRIYELGKKKLLKKCENRCVPNLITNILTMGSRIYATDVQESVLFYRYKSSDNQLLLFADDTYQRYCTCICLLDFDTVAIGDKFGNICVLRLPQNTMDDVQEDPTGIRALWDKGLLNGASQKCEILAMFYVSETVTSLRKTTLIAGSSDIVVYTTINGAIGALVPLTTQEDYNFFAHLEMHMRSEFAPLCGRDHISYRSYYAPVKAVIDGDFCEQYSMLDAAKRREIATDLDRTPTEVFKKLEDIRTRYAF